MAIDTTGWEDPGKEVKMMGATNVASLLANLEDPRQARERDRRIALRESQLASGANRGHSSDSVLTRFRAALHLDAGQHDAASCED